MLESRKARAAVGIAAGLLSLVSAGRAAAGGDHTVVAGDTLSDIAAAYTVTVQAIAELNGIANPDLIFPGDQLKIPGLAAESAMEPGLYVVQAGDTLSAIGKRHGVAVTALQDANGIGDSDLIIIGQRLVIPSQPPADPLAMLPSEPPDDPELAAILEEFAAAEGLDAGMVKALAFAESSWDQGARSPAGAVGVMQLMPETAAWLEQDVFGYELNEDTSVYDNVKAGTRLVRILVDGNGGDVDAALASYYQGQGATSAGIMYEDTRGYLRFVHGVWERYWR